LSIPSEASTPLDVPVTPHLAARISRYWPLPLYPALATASLSNITVGFPHHYTLQPTVDRLAPYCSSLPILGLRFASYIPLGSTGCLPVYGLCPPLSSPWASPRLPSWPFCL